MTCGVWFRSSITSYNHSNSQTRRRPGTWQTTSSLYVCSDTEQTFHIRFKPRRCQAMIKINKKSPQSKSTCLDPQLVKIALASGNPCAGPKFVRTRINRQHCLPRVETLATLRLMHLDCTGLKSDTRRFQILFQSYFIQEILTKLKMNFIYRQEIPTN